ncbi:hypothetical protein BASA61_002068 [Batrachochytrium salamandrivorans]|nr:hypothetical protein BASA61_002068 [Batrachochytrium salamandrivorans]
MLGRALDPGVENVYTWLRGGVLNGEADLDQRWLIRTVEHESMGTRHDNRALGSTATTGKANPLPVVLSLTYRECSLHHGKGKPAPSGAFTHRIREDGEIFSGEEGRETSSDTTPLASVAGSVRMRSTDSDRSVRATPKKARDASPPPQDDLWVVIKNLSQQVAAQQAEMDALRNTIALQQKATANLEKILGNMASQAASTSEVTQTALAAILARLEVKPDVPKVVVVDNDYPPLPPTGATSKRKTMATKPNPTTATTATTTTTTTTDQPSKDTRFADAVKRRPTHQQLVERQPEFRKAGAAAWLALKRETSVPAHSAPKSGALFGSPTHLCKWIPLCKAWRPSKGNAGCPHSYKRSTWITNSRDIERELRGLGNAFREEALDSGRSLGAWHVVVKEAEETKGLEEATLARQAFKARWIRGRGSRQGPNNALFAVVLSRLLLQRLVVHDEQSTNKTQLRFCLTQKGHGICYSDLGSHLLVAKYLSIKRLCEEDSHCCGKSRFGLHVKYTPWCLIIC